MNFHTRKWIKPQDLNPNETLFGGRLLEWIDEEAALYAIIQLENPRTVTKFMSEINFRSSAKKGDIILIAGKGHETYQQVSGIESFKKFRDFKYPPSLTFHCFSNFERPFQKAIQTLPNQSRVARPVNDRKYRLGYVRSLPNVYPC